MLFVPRQVRLTAASAPAAAAMAKEEAKKEKRSKSKAVAAAMSSPAPDARVLAAVAAFLESSGLPRTLAALQSEANIEVHNFSLALSYALYCHSGARLSSRRVGIRCFQGDSWRSSPVNLEEAVSKLLESRYIHQSTRDSSVYIVKLLMLLMLSPLGLPCSLMRFGYVVQQTSNVWHFSEQRAR
jgi:hypothetical protein